MTEIWKDIEGYDGKYQVSNMGRIRSVDHYGPHGGFIKADKYYKGIILKLQKDSRGYTDVKIQGKHKKVHRLVAMAFVPGYFAGAEVNHKDENPQNNRWDNLEWCSHNENMSYGSCKSNMTKTTRERRGTTIEQYDTNGNLIATYQSIRHAAKEMGVSDTRLHCILDRNNTCKGYLFKRKTN